jgi:hypothetical protein
MAMTVRTLCFIGAVIAPAPWRWFLAIGAVLLPYLAVVIANAGLARSDNQGVRVLAVRPFHRAVGRGN